VRARQTAMVLAVAVLSSSAFSALARPANAAVGSRRAPAVLVGTPSAASAAAAGWLGRQLTPAGYLPSATTPGTADLSGTAATVLALEATRTGAAQVTGALGYLAAHIEDFVAVDGSDAPGQLALLILAAHGAGADPHAFGGTDLVARLEGTRRVSGADSGLFGAQDPTFDGAFRQGLALTALGAVGVADAAAVSWLQTQQCTTGAWMSYRANPVTACPPVDPVNFSGPDTNSTALAVEGLSTQHAAAVHDPLAFLTSVQGSDGGWAFFGAPNQPSDADSTALVMQAFEASGVALTDPRFTAHGPGPLAFLGTLSAGCTGAFAFQPGAGGALAPDRLATEQVAPALAQVVIPTAGPLSATLAGAGCGYWLADAAGTLYSAGSPSEAALTGHLNDPVVAMAAASSGHGAWLAAADGGVFTVGDAKFFGSAGDIRLNKPIVAIAATPDGGGYWLAAADGGIFTYGDAKFFGSAGDIRLNKPIVAIAATPDGGGYWLAATDGGIFTYGDAKFDGSAGNLTLNRPIVALAATPDGGGYWLAATDGGIFTYGDAKFDGSAGNLTLNRPIVALAATPDGGGYWLAATDGGVFTYGDAAFHGAFSSPPLAHPIAAVAADPMPLGA
jgi:hypothetical protein